MNNQPTRFSERVSSFQKNVQKGFQEAVASRQLAAFTAPKPGHQPQRSYGVQKAHNVQRAPQGSGFGATATLDRPGKLGTNNDRFSRNMMTQAVELDQSYMESRSHSPSTQAPTSAAFMDQTAAFAKIKENNYRSALHQSRSSFANPRIKMSAGLDGQPDINSTVPKNGNQNSNNRRKGYPKMVQMGEALQRQRQYMGSYLQGAVYGHTKKPLRADLKAATMQAGATMPTASMPDSPKTEYIIEGGHLKKNESDQTPENEKVDYWEEEMMKTEKKEDIVQKRDKSIWGKFKYKMMNGNPASKAFIVFLLAPKGLVFFSPLLFKKYLPTRLVSYFSGISMKAMGLGIYKLGLGFLLFKFYQQYKTTVNYNGSKTAPPPMGLKKVLTSPLQMSVAQVFELAFLTTIVFVTSRERVGLFLMSAITLSSQGLEMDKLEPAPATTE